MHQHSTITLTVPRRLLIACAILVPLLAVGLAAGGLTLATHRAAAATPAPDIRAGLLADIAAYEARFGWFVIPETAPEYLLAPSQSFLMGHPELARYVTWAWPRRSTIGLLMQNLRDERNLRDYLAQR